jgi:hypothetical protein
MIISEEKSLYGFDFSPLANDIVHPGKAGMYLSNYLIAALMVNTIAAGALDIFIKVPILKSGKL